MRLSGSRILVTTFVSEKPKKSYMTYQEEFKHVRTHPCLWRLPRHQLLVVEKAFPEQPNMRLPASLALPLLSAPWLLASLALASLWAPWLLASLALPLLSIPWLPASPALPL